MMTLKALNRFHAAGLHLLGSVCVAMLSSALVFLLWYPGLLAYASDVGKIFLLLLAVDVVLGPFITLIIFNPEKKELKRDLAVIVVVQLAALLYGLHTVFITRPVYIAYNAGRFDLVYANEISAENLAKASRPEFRSLPYFGPQVIASPLPDNQQEREKIVASALAGGADVQQMPQYYLPYAERKSEALRSLVPLENLGFANKDKKRQLDDLIKKYAEARIGVGYLPLKGKPNDLVVVLNGKTGEILEMSDLNPWGIQQR